MKNACSVLITSCDGYNDLWTPFFTLFWRYWPDCPYPVYLSTNHRDLGDPRVTTLAGTSENVWTVRIREHLKLLETPYVLMCLEDFFFRAPVSTPDVEECLQKLSSLNGHVVRLLRRPGPDAKIPGEEKFGNLSPGVPYRVSTQAAIWNRETLISLMSRPESIWDFEARGSERSGAYPTGFYGVRRDVFTYRHHVVERGKWFPWDAYRYRKADIGCDFDRRPTMTNSEALSWCAAKVRTALLAWIPWPTRLRLVRFLKSLSRGENPGTS